MSATAASVGARAQRLWERQATVIAVYALAGGLFVATGLVSTGFFQPHNIQAALVFSAILGIVALSQTFVLLLGGIDLSVPWTMTMAAIIVSVETPRHGLAVALLLGLGLCALAGMANGIAVTFFGLSPIIMTLAMSGIVQGGISTWAAGNGFVSAPASLTRFAGRTIAGIPSLVLVWLVLAAATVTTLALTRYGRHLYAVGANARVAFLSGVSLHRTTVVAYLLSAVVAGLDGVLLSGYVTQAYLGMGSSYLFPSIAAVVLGGVSIYGGRGGYLGPMGGALALIFLEFLLAALGLATNSQEIVFGIVLLLAISLPRLRREVHE